MISIEKERQDFSLFIGLSCRAPSVSRRRRPNPHSSSIRLRPTGLSPDPSGIQGFPHQIKPRTLPTRAKGRDGSSSSFTPRPTHRRSRRDTAGRRNGGHPRHGRHSPIVMYVRAIHGNGPAAAPARALVTVPADPQPPHTAPSHRHNVPPHHTMLFHSFCHIHETLPTHGQGPALRRT